MIKGIVKSRSDFLLLHFNSLKNLIVNSTNPVVLAKQAAKWFFGHNLLTLAFSKNNPVVL